MAQRQMPSQKRKQCKWICFNVKYFFNQPQTVFSSNLSTFNLRLADKSNKKWFVVD